MTRQNRIFRNAMFFEVMLEVVGIFMHWQRLLWWRWLRRQFCGKYFFLRNEKEGIVNAI